jgi:hypothetical protein
VELRPQPELSPSCGPDRRRFGWKHLFRIARYPEALESSWLLDIQTPSPLRTIGGVRVTHLTEAAERLGLVSAQAIAGIVHGIPVDDFCKLVEVTTKAIFLDEQAADQDAYGAAVVASSSLRSDTGCRCWNCRQFKLEALARYACLYTDRLIVPVSLTAMLTDEEPARIAIADLYYKLSVLRPLFDEGIAIFAPDIHCFCVGCGEGFDALCREFDAASFEVYLERIGIDIRVVYRPPTRTHSWYVELDGPAEYIPHGRLRLQPVGGYTKRPRWAPKKLTRIGKAPGAVLTPDEIRKFRVGGTHFAQLARDAVMQQYNGLKYDAPYLTDSPVEARFLERAYPRDEGAAFLREILTQLRHEVPLLGDVPLRRIIRIRESNYDSFQLYRTALQQVVRDYISGGRPCTSKAARDICADVILPQVRKLRTEASAKRRSAVRKAVAGTIAVSAAIGIGVISGMIPPALERVFQIGGIALAGKLGDLLGAIERHPAEIRSHNMYFLLRLLGASPNSRRPLLL